jgi:hypothetical protein
VGERIFLRTLPSFSTSDIDGEPAIRVLTLEFMAVSSVVSSPLPTACIAVAIFNSSSVDALGIELVAFETIAAMEVFSKASDI